MPNKCVAFGCKADYLTAHTNVSKFAFRLNNSNLLIYWIKFGNRSDWKPTKNSLLCINYFENKFIHYSNRNKLKWHLNPIPTIHSTEALKQSSTLPTSSPPLRKAPKIRVPQNDELSDFNKKDVAFKFEEITEAHCPAGFQCFQDENQTIFYNIIFDHLTNFPWLPRPSK